MILQRALLKIFAPRRLRYRDVTAIYQAMTQLPGHCVTGSHLANLAYIPEHDLEPLLSHLEQFGAIERVHNRWGSFFPNDVLACTWAMGERFTALMEKGWTPR